MIEPYQQYMYSYPHKTAYSPLSNVHLRDYINRLSGKENSLYFHIPFCQYKCGYCNLFSAAGLPEQYMAAYVEAMERQSVQLAEILPRDVSFMDLTLGGGTPLLLPLHLLERVFGLAEEYFHFQREGHSIVVETSPNQTTEEKLALLKEKGVSRISIGVQSFQEAELALLHRFHTAQAARKALELIRRMKFDRVNVDLIYGIRGQTIESLLDSLKQAVEYDPEELFVYPLYIQPGTYLYGKGARRHKEMPKMYDRIREFLLQAGYAPYSMRRFVKTGGTYQEADRRQGINTKGARPASRRNVDINLPESRRNGDTGLPESGRNGDTGLPESRRNGDINLPESGRNGDTGLPESLCGFGNTISVGCGGRSYIGNLHFCTPYAVGRERCLSILADYMEQEDHLQITHGYLLSEEEEKRRYIIRHILFGTGINLLDYQKHFGSGALDEFPQLLEWERDGYAVLRDGHMMLTKEGMALSDHLGPRLISDAVRKKCDSYNKRME